MNLQVDIQLDKAQLRNVQKMLAKVKGGATRAIVRGVNDTARTVHSEIKRELKATLPPLKFSEPGRTKASEVSKSVHLSKASYRTPSALISISGSRLPVYALSGRPRQPQYPKGSRRGRRLKKTSSWQLPGGSRRTGKGIFTARLHTGHIGIFRRFGDSIKELYGPSIPALVERTPNLSALTKSLPARLLMANVNKHVNKLLATGGRY